MKFQTITLDPPWRYGDTLGGIIRGAEAHYDTMSLADIADLPIYDLADENAHVYLWVTNAFMKEAMMLMDVWNLKQKTILTWVKTSIGMGHYYRNTTEHCLFATKGKLPPKLHNVPTHFVAPRSKHSRKPDVFFDIVESMSPFPALEIFARERRPNWAAYGDELGGLIDSEGNYVGQTLWSNTG